MKKNKDAEKLSRKQHYEKIRMLKSWVGNSIMKKIRMLKCWVGNSIMKKNKDAEKLSRKLHYEKNKERSKSYHKQDYREYK